MPLYRLYRLDAKNAFRGAEVIDAESDEQALALAEAAYEADGVMAGYELWDRGRPIHRKLALAAPLASQRGT